MPRVTGILLIIIVIVILESSREISRFPGYGMASAHGSAAHFLCIGEETGKRTVFWVKNTAFIGNFDG
jgi:hypothetical protein